MDTPVGRLDVFALDCPEPHELAEFYRLLVGGEIVEHPDGHWVELHTGRGKIAFQRVADHRPPTWPGNEIPQQAHIDIDVDDLAAATAAAIDLGAVPAATQPSPKDFRVFLDPAGHPFCLVLPWPESRSV